MAKRVLTDVKKSDPRRSLDDIKLPDFINVIKKESTGSTNEDIALLAKQGIAPLDCRSGISSNFWTRTSRKVLGFSNRKFVYVIIVAA